MIMTSVDDFADILDQTLAEVAPCRRASLPAIAGELAATLETAQRLETIVGALASVLIGGPPAASADPDKPAVSRVSAPILEDLAATVDRLTGTILATLNDAMRLQERLT